MKLKLKICGMREPENIRELVQVHPDYIGFIFYERSPRYAGNHIDKIKEVEIPSTIKKVGVFVNNDLNKILQVHTDLAFDAVQLHGSEPASLCEELRKEGLDVIKVFSVGEGFDFSQMKPYIDFVDYFLFDTKGKYYGGNSLVFDWGMIEKYPFQKPFFLGGGIGNDNILEIQDFVNPYLYAVDANSKLESSPGKKDLEQVIIFRSQVEKIDL